MENDERLVIKIYGDATQFESTMKGVGDTIQDAGKAVEKASVGIKNDIADATSATKRDFGTWATDVSAKMKSFSDTMGTLGTKLTKTLTVPLALFGGIAIKGAMAHEDSLGAMSAIYGDSSDSIVGSIQNIDSAFGISQSNALTWSAEIGAMLQEVSGISAEEAGRMSVNLLKMAGDMAAMYGGTVEEAYNAIKSGLVGQSRPLLRYGVVADVDKLKSNASSSGMWQEGEDFTREMRSAAYLDTLFDQTTKITGQANRELENASGQLRSLKAEMSDLATEVGYQLLPIFVDVLGVLKSVVSWFSNLEEGTQKNIVKFGLLLAATGPVINILSKTTGGLSKVIGGLGKLATKAKDAGGLPGMASKIKSTIIPALTGPVGIVVASAAVIGVLALLVNTADTTANRLRHLKKESKKLDKAMRENVQAAEAQAGGALFLAERFEYLNNKTSRTKEEQQELVVIVGQLNSMYPDLAWEIDKTTGSVEGNTKAVYDLIEAQLTEALMAAYNDRIVEGLKERQKAVEELAIAEEKSEREARERAEKWESFTPEQQGQQYNYVMYGPDYEGSNDVELAYAHLEEIDAKNQELLANAANMPNQVNEFMGATTGAYKDGYEGQANATTEGGEKVSAEFSLQEQRREYHRRVLGDLNEEELAQLQTYHEGIAIAYNNLLGKAEEFHKKYFNIEQNGITQKKLTAAQAKANLDQSNKDYAKWAAEMETVASKVPEDVLVELRKLGPEHVLLIQDLNKMSDEELVGFVESWRLSAENAVDASTEELELIESGAVGIVEAMVIAIGEQNPYIRAMGKELGKELYAGVLAGIEEGNGPVITASKRLMNDSLDSMRNTAEIYSPSKATTKLGEYLAEGVGVGILNRSKYVSQRAKEIMDAAIFKMRNTAVINSPSKATTEMGEQLGQGLVNGLKSQTKSLAKTAGNLMKVVIDGIDGNLEFQKPALIGGGNDTFSFAGSGVNQSNFKEGNTTINLNGNYTFREKEEMDYFMNQLELAVRRA